MANPKEMALLGEEVKSHSTLRRNRALRIVSNLRWRFACETKTKNRDLAVTKMDENFCFMGGDR